MVSSICQGKMAGDTEIILKSQWTNFHLQALILGSAEGGQSGLEMFEGSLGLVAWGENGRNSYQNSCADSFPILQKPSFSDRTLPSKEHQAEGKQ